MPVGQAQGYPNLTYEGLSQLIPILWAAEAREKFYAATCLPSITNPNILGAADIKQMGDRIKIATVPNVPNHPYVKGQLLNIDYLESPSVTMTVDYARNFNFAVDKIDLKQVKIKDWISRYSDDANKNMKIDIETEVFGSIYASAAATNMGNLAGAKSANIVLGATGTPVTLTKSNILDKLAEAGQVLTENNIPETDRWVVGPAWMKTLLVSSDLKNAALTGDSSSALRTGRIGEIHDFTVYTSNLLAVDAGTSDCHLLFGHKSSIWFVSQYTETEMYKPERGFAQAMKGLNVYGYGVLQPTGLGQMVANKG